MKDAIAYLLIGLGAGGFYAMLASGVVVAFKGSGVINFAHGAMAMFVGFQFHYLRTKSRLQLPWVDFLPFKWLNLPVTIRFDAAGGKMSFLPAFILSMLTAVLLGAMAHFLVFRPLRNAAPLGKVIGSLGVMLYLQGVALKNFGSDNPNPRAVFPDGLFRNFLGLGKPMSHDRLLFAVFAVAIGAALWVFFQYTRFGLATRAAAGNEKGAVLLGYSPERLALANWIVSAVLAGLAGVFVGSITGALSPTKYTGLIVPALGAALIGRLSSIPWAVGGGLVIGMLDSWTQTWLTLQKWWPKFITSSGAKDALPLIVIVLVLVVRGKSLPIRGTVEEKRLPLAPYPKRVWQWCLIAGGAAIILATGLPGGWGFAGLDGIWGLALSTTLITAMIMLSNVVLTGYVGQISLAQMSMAGVSAFITARFMANGLTGPDQPFPVQGLDWPWPPAAIGGILVAILVGVVVGLPAVRIRGVQLAVVTIAAAVLLQTEYFENDHLTDLRAGANAVVHDPTFFGWDLKSVGAGGLIDNPRFAIFCVIVLCLLCVAVANLRRSGTGRRMLAVRANERAAAAAGIEVPRTKLLAFAIASGIAGVAGIMTGFQQRQVSSANWVFLASLAVLAFAYLGGITSINGAIVGGVIGAGGLVAVFGNYHNPGFTPYVALLGGVGMILTAIIHPEGQAPFWQPALQYFGRWITTGPPEKFPKAVVRVLPGTIPGALFAWWLIIAKAEHWRNWHLLIIVAVGLMSRGTAKRIIDGVRATRAGAPTGGGHGALPPPTSAESAPALAEA
jgi:branched-chain amino acid transport system permease protein